MSTPNAFLTVAPNNNTYIIGSKQYDMIFATQCNTQSFIFGNCNIYFYIASNGNIGIGNSNPIQKLHVTGNAKINGYLEVTDDTSYGHIEVGGSAGAYIDLKNPSTDDYDFRISTDGTSNIIYTSNDRLQLPTNITTSNNTITLPNTINTQNIKLNAASNHIIDNYYATNIRYGLYMSNSNIKLYTACNSGTISLSHCYGDGLFVDRLFINSLGYIGIGTTTPTCPLHITNILNTTAVTGYAHYGTNSNLVASTPVSINLSLRTSGAIVNDGGGIFAASDKRIKTDIQDINNALDTLRQLEPKTFKYKDSIMRGDRISYGFIAQQVVKILSSAVSSNHDNFIPNIYSMAKINSNILILDKSCTNNIIYDSLGQSNLELQIYDTSNVKYEITVDKIINDNMIKLTESLIQDRVFVFGQRVYDFNILNKDDIFTVGIAALQEMDKQLQMTITCVNELKNELTNIKHKLTLANLI
jgi:hypothetical protein